MDKHTEADKRLIHLINKYFPTRGRFGELERASGISASKWKNFYYRKQSATQAMMDYWCKTYTMEALWLTTGEAPAEQSDFPFHARIPIDSSSTSIADRMIWAISEFAAPYGESLFSYLEQRSNGLIPASEWANVILKATPPTAEMVRVVSEGRDQIFTEWIIHGRCIHIQVDPSDSSSVKKWKEMVERIWSRE